MAASLDLFIRKLRVRHDLSAEEESAIRSMRVKELHFERGDVMVQPGVLLENSLLLLGGFAFRSKIAADGTLQIVETNVCGDFVDLHGFVLKRLEHEVSAAAPSHIAQVPHTELKRIMDRFPRLTRLLWFQTLVDASIHREWMLVLGKKRSRARIAQFFCEMQARLSIVGLVDGNQYSLPFNQQELADITGMTPVHLNRSLKELRDSGLVTFRNGQVELHDLEKLKRDAQFDPRYLYLGRQDI